MSPVLRISAILCLGWAAVSFAEEVGPANARAWDSLHRPELNALGSLSCASTACHGNTATTPATATRREFTRWFDHDPHARSAQTLRSGRFELILSAIAGKNAGTAQRAAVYRRCAACHDPQEVAGAKGQGIGCEACHGNAEQWYTVHYEEGSNRADASRLGMIDMDNLLVRGRLCAQCHVGGPDHDLNHDMLAAGHPPLRFELSAYHDLIKNKHWSDAERLNRPHFKAQLWAAGQVASTEASLALLESRAARAIENDGLTPWPEFAEYDCFACHQRLGRVPGSTIPLKAATPGIPGWQPWNLALADALFSGSESPAATGRLRTSLGSNLAPDPARTRDLAAAARIAVREAGISTRLTAGQLLDMIEGQIRLDQPWAESCQQLLALKAGYTALRDGRMSSERQVSEEIEAIERQLRFRTHEVEWPVIGGDPGDTELRDALQLLVRELKELAAQSQGDSF